MELKISKYAFLTKRKQANNQAVCLLFSGRTAKNIVVSDRVNSLLEKGKYDELSTEVRNILVNNKILVPTSEDELSEVNKENEKALDSMPHDRLYISVQTTAYCQLACDYCGQEHSKMVLNNNTIDAIICRVRKKLGNHPYKKLELGWFGGEPLYALIQMRLLNVKIQKLAEEAKVSYIGHITTNGYVLTTALYKELKNDFNVHRIEITLDGSAEYHDRRRFTVNGKGSFERIFKNLVSIVASPEYNPKDCAISIRCNVDERNIDGVLPLLESFVKKGIQDKILFYSTAVVSWSNNGAGSLEAKKVLGKKSLEYIAYMLKHGFKTDILPHRTGPFICIGTDPFGDSEMYDADGNIFDCSETSYSSYYAKKGYVLGNVSEQNLIDRRSKLHEMPKEILKGEVHPCSDCKFYPVCGGLCVLGLSEEEPRCPSFIYDFEDRMFLDFYSKRCKI